VRGGSGLRMRLRASQADVAELIDARHLKSLDLQVVRFESRRPHQQ
jgi:hypothetical protein